jgi:hypothetical protein
MSIGSMEQFDECGSLAHGGEMVRLAGEAGKSAALETQLTSASDVSQAKNYFGQFEPPAPPATDLPGLSLGGDTQPLGNLPTGDVSLLPGADAAVGAPGGLISGLFEIMTEVLTTTPMDATQLASNINQG